MSAQRKCYHMKELVMLNKKEQKRSMVLNQMEKGEMIGRDAAKVLNVSLHHVRRLVAAYRKEGVATLVECYQLKIHLFCPRYYPHIGRVETHMRSVSQRLQKTSFEVEISTLDAPTGALEQMRQKG